MRNIFKCRYSGRQYCWPSSKNKKRLITISKEDRFIMQAEGWYMMLGTPPKMGIRIPDEDMVLCRNKS